MTPHSQLDGRSGLVPASFMTELPADSAGRRSREASPVLPGTSKVRGKSGERRQWQCWLAVSDPSVNCVFVSEGEV